MKAALLFTLLILISGSAWLLPESDCSVPCDLGLGAISFAFTACFVGLRDPFHLPELKEAATWKGALLGSLALGLPSILLATMRGEIASSMVLAIWAFLPAIVSLRQQIVNAATSKADNSSLTVSLLGSAGLLLLLPLRLPSGSKSMFAFAIAVAAAISSALAAPACCEHLQQRTEPRALRAVSTGASLSLGLGSILSLIVTPSTLASSGSSLLLHGAFALAEAALLVLSVKGLTPERFATRALMTPLVGILEAVLLLHLGISWRMTAGFLLALFGTVGLWRLSTDRVTGSMSLRGPQDVAERG